MKLALALLCITLTLTTCTPCTLRDCQDSLKLEVRSPDGGVVDRFRGTVTMDGEAIPFECPAEQNGESCVDAGVISINLNSIGRTSNRRSIGVRQELLVSVTAPDAGLGWSGSLTSLSVNYPNGPACGPPPCIDHSKQVVLEPK